MTQKHHKTQFGSQTQKLPNRYAIFHTKMLQLAAAISRNSTHVVSTNNQNG